MAESSLSWKQAVFWPLFKVEFLTTKVRTCIFVVFGLLFSFHVYSAVFNGKWMMLLYVPGTYIVVGVLGWSEELLRRSWARFANAYPKWAKQLNRLSLIPLWQVRVIAAKEAAPLFLQFWCWALYTVGFIAYFGLQFDRMSVVTYGIVAGYALAVTLGTGVLLALIEWWEPEQLRI